MSQSAAQQSLLASFAPELVDQILCHPVDIANALTPAKHTEKNLYD